MYLDSSVQNAPIEPELTDAQLSRNFTMFKSVFMAGMKPGEGRTVDVEAALSKLENTVLQISDGVATGKSFQKPSGYSIDSDDDYTTPSNKGKRIVQRNDPPAKATPLRPTPSPKCNAPTSQEEEQPLPGSSQHSGSNAPSDIVSALKQGRSHKGTATKSFKHVHPFPSNGILVRRDVTGRSVSKV